MKFWKKRASAAPQNPPASAYASEWRKNHNAALAGATLSVAPRPSVRPSVCVLQWRRSEMNLKDAITPTMPTATTADNKTVSFRCSRRCELGLNKQIILKQTVMLFF